MTDSTVVVKEGNPVWKHPCKTSRRACELPTIGLVNLGESPSGWQSYVLFILEFQFAGLSMKF